MSTVYVLYSLAGILVVIYSVYFLYRKFETAPVASHGHPPVSALVVSDLGRIHDQEADLSMKIDFILRVLNEEVRGQVKFISIVSDKLVQQMDQHDEVEILGYLADIRNSSSELNSVLSNIITWSTLAEERSIQLSAVEIGKVFTSLNKTIPVDYSNGIKYNIDNVRNSQLVALSDEYILEAVIRILILGLTKYFCRDVIYITAVNNSESIDIELFELQGGISDAQFLEFEKSMELHLYELVNFQFLNFKLAADILKAMRSELIFTRINFQGRKCLKVIMRLEHVS